MLCRVINHLRDIIIGDPPILAHIHKEKKMFMLLDSQSDLESWETGAQDVGPSYMLECTNGNIYETNLVTLRREVIGKK
jgi:hypothetical protein